MRGQNPVCTVLVLFLFAFAGCTGPLNIPEALGGSPWPLDSVDYRVGEARLTTPGASAGGSLSGVFDLQNTGSRDDTGELRWTVYASRDGSIGAGDLILASGSLQGLASGQEIEDVPFSATWPADGGDYFLLVLLDSPADGDPTDNQCSTSLVSLGTPTDPSMGVSMPEINYAVEAVDVLESGQAGELLASAVFLVSNTTGATGTLDLSYTVHWSQTPQVGSNATLVEMGTTAPPPPNGGVKVTFSDAWPQDQGEYYVIVTILCGEDTDRKDDTLAFGPLKVAP
jgi:hypothetical protein